MTVYALLVGIDAYQADVPRLRGAVSDITHVAQFLDVHVGGKDLRCKTLLNGQATRAAVIEAFRTHLTQAGPEDAALFWFSGHGSQMPAEESRFLRSEPSRFLQTLVCADSRQGDVPDLLDKEINILISAITASGAHMTAVFDCCHSDGASRWPETLWVRRTEPARRMPSPDLLIPELAAFRGPGKDDHVSLAACQSHQIAYEIPVGDGHRGVFSLMLLKHLGERSLSYHEVLARTRCLVEAERPDQWPTLTPVLGPLADQAFLGGQAAPAETALTMRYMADGWYVNAGTCHGLEAGTPEDPTLLGLDDDDRLRQVRVLKVAPDRSRVEPVGWQPADLGRHYPVVVTRIPIPTATLLLDRETGDPAEQRTLALVADALASAGPYGGPSPHVRMLAPGDVRKLPELRVAAAAPGLAVIRNSDADPVDAPQPCQSPEDALKLVRRVEHIASWRRMLTLDNPRTRLAGAVAIDVVPARSWEDYDPMDRPPMAADGSGTVHFAYRRERGEWVPPDGAFVRLRNLTTRRLYCVLLDMTGRFRMHPHMFPGGWIAPGTAYVQDGRRIDFTLPPDQRPAPGANVVDWMKVLVSETRIDSSLFVLPHLGEPLPDEEAFRRSKAKAAKAAKKSPGVQSVIDGLGFTAMERGAEDRALEDRVLPGRDAIVTAPTAGDWTTAVLKVVTSVPDEERPD
jgi:hypothetical protein